MVLLAIAAALACAPPPVDEESSVPPSGVIEGTVLYVGPRPPCQNDGEAIRPIGRVVLTLFEHANPPPPEGRARSASGLLTVPGRELFPEPSDCMPLDPDPEDLEPITRSAEIVWPGIPLGGAYQLRAFYDADGDFVPFFGVRTSPSRGDVLGGAFADATGAAGMLRIAFDTAEARPLGQVRSGVVITLAAPVNTEPPRFRLHTNDGTLDSTHRWPVSLDPLADEQAMWEQVGARLELFRSDDEAVEDALAAAGIEHAFDPVSHAWYLRELDIDRDGAPDLHPLLGAGGIPWRTPILVFSRARTPAEQAAGVPEVQLIASPRPSRFGRSVVARSLAMLVPPAAVVDLAPGLDGCRIPYLAPGNIAPLYEGRPVECQELPTGRYGYSVLHGVAGAQPRSGVEPAESETGFTLDGGLFSGQSWSIPNELGPPDRRYDPFARPQLDRELMLWHQGPGARLTVQDPTPEDGARHDCAEAPDPAAGGAPRPVAYEPVPAACCAAVAHLCGLPLCEPPPETGAILREVDDLDADGLPGCLPFEMPASCCDGR